MTFPDFQFSSNSPAVEHGLVGVYTLLVNNVHLLIMLIGNDKVVIIFKRKLRQEMKFTIVSKF